MYDWALCCKAIKMGWKVSALKESYLKIYINHNSVRMSDSGFYKDSCERYIKFHTYFLNEYHDIIKLYPKTGVTHYESLISNLIYMSHMKEAFGIWKKLIKARTNIRSLIVFPYYYIRVSLKNEY